MPSNEDLDNVDDLENLEDLEENEDVDEDAEDSDIDRGDDFDSDDDGDEEDDPDDQEDRSDVNEDDDDGNEDEDEESEDEASEEDEEDPKNRIPKQRLDQVLKQRDDERDRSKWLESQLEKLIEKGLDSKQDEAEEVDPFDYDAAEHKYTELILEGDVGKAVKVRNLIDRSRQEDIEALIAKATKNVSEKAEGESTKRLEDSKFDDLVETYEGLHPFLDANSPDFDEDKTKLVNTLLAGHIAQGMSKRESLKLAIKHVAKPGKTETKTKLGNSRSKQARKKSADASNRQPAKNRSKKVANIDTDTVTISKLSERDYNKLTLRERKVLRGD